MVLSSDGPKLEARTQSVVHQLPQAKPEGEKQRLVVGAHDSASYPLASLEVFGKPYSVS